MDAPKGRYRVVEKDGRLVVIDNATNVPVTPSIPPPRAASRPGATSGPIAAGPIAPGKGALDGAADALLTLAVNRWDREGQAVIRWRWTENNEPKSWDALLDSSQQRRLGRALLCLAAAPVLFLALILVGLPWLSFLIGLPLLFWGVRSIGRLRTETAGQPRPPEA